MYESAVKQLCFFKFQNNQMISGVKKKYQSVNYQAITWMKGLYQSMNKMLQYLPKMVID